MAGRIDVAELDRRLETVLRAADHAAAASALADLPPLEIGLAPRKRPRRRHGEHGAAAAGWIPTLERFRDPSSGRLMRVWHDPVDGGRHYLAEAAAR